MKKVLLYTLIMIIYPTILFAQAPDTLWTKTYGRRDPDVGNSVKQTSDGGYIVAGTTESFGGAYNFDAWLLKTDENGDTVWTHLFDNHDCDFASDAEQTSDGGYIISGIVADSYWLCKTNSSGDSIEWEVYEYTGVECCLTSVIETSDKGYITSGWWYWGHSGAAILLKTDSLGNVLWNNGYNHGSHQGGAKGYSVLQTADGGYVVGGHDQRLDFYYFKTDSIGEVIWYTILDDGQNYSCAYSAERAHDGGFIFTGYKGSYLYIVKSDSAGDTLWTKTYGRSDVVSVGNSIQQTLDGGYIIVGNTAPDSQNNDNVWLLKIDAAGDTIWTKTYGGIAEDRGYCVQQSSDGGYIIAGYTHSFGAGDADIWLIKTEPDVGAEEDDNITIRYDDYTMTIFSGTLLLPDGKNCRVFDITGRVVTPQHIKPGIYFIEVDGEIKQKVVKIR